MKKITHLVFLLIAPALFAQQQTVTYSVSPETFEETDNITITFNGSSINEATWGVTNNALYLWAWSFDTTNSNIQDSPNNGEWTSSNEAQKLTYNSSTDTYSISFVPTTFYNRTGIGRIGFLIKAKNGTGDKKSQDILVDVGAGVTPPDTIPEAAVPSGLLDGLNLDPADPSKATMVLYAPNKDYVHVIGNFNNWMRDDDNYLMNKDSAKDRFWIELTGLTANTDYMYQYLVDGEIRVADPYSALILDEFNDQFISNTTFPGLPDYPEGDTNHAVTWFKTGETAYDWQIDNFTPPAKTDLVIYELLIRDFDELHSYDAISDRLDYLEGLGVNAIEFMPLNEFDGNLSWGYNPSFHMGIDKYYGTPTAFKQLVDECHSRGIAVIVDVVYNHASGQNPYFRLWNTSSGDYSGQATAENPFFNAVAKHSYSVFNDFDHSSQATRDYVKRTAQFWIDEYNVDGFRWDLTKGFTQNCENNESCTNSYQADRVAVLKEYADYQWATEDDFLVIFEHLGGITEEKEWADYRAGEGKGIMLWNKQTDPYNESTMGYHDGGKSNIVGVSYKSKGFDGPSAISYMESHDEQRLMYKNLEFGNISGSYSVKDLSTALNRMESIGAFFFTVPGPKMIWQFGELGYEVDIDFNGRTGEKPIRWEYLNNADRTAIYDTWSKLIKLKLNEPIFQTDNFSIDASAITGLKSIHLTLDSATGNELKYITIIGNFDVQNRSINPNFQEAGTWYDLMNDNAEMVVNNVNETISLAPGEFMVLGNEASTLSTSEAKADDVFKLYPNPTTSEFYLNKSVSEVHIYTITGKLVKTFKGDFSPTVGFDISELSRSLYIVKIKNQQGQESSSKLIKF